MSKLTHIATLRAANGKSEMLGAALQELVSPTRAETGCLSYELHRGKDDREIWVVYERWNSPTDADAHLAQPYVQKFITRLGDLVVGDIAVLRCEYISM